MAVNLAENNYGESRVRLLRVIRQEGRHDIKELTVGIRFEGDFEASVANTGQVSSRIIDLQPAAQIVKQTWSEIETALSESRSRLGEGGAAS